MQAELRNPTVDELIQQNPDGLWHLLDGVRHKLVSFPDGRVGVRCRIKEPGFNLDPPLLLIIEGNWWQITPAFNGACTEEHCFHVNTLPEKVLKSLRKHADEQKADQADPDYDPKDPEFKLTSAFLEQTQAQAQTLEEFAEDLPGFTLEPPSLPGSPATPDCGSPRSPSPPPSPVAEVELRATTGGKAPRPIDHPTTGAKTLFAKPDVIDLVVDEPAAPPAVEPAVIQPVAKRVNEWGKLAEMTNELEDLVYVRTVDEPEKFEDNVQLQMQITKHLDVIIANCTVLRKRTSDMMMKNFDKFAKSVEPNKKQKRSVKFQQVMNK